MQSIKGADGMQNLKIHETTYSKIFKLDEGTLVKYSLVKKSAWETLKAKNISFINSPRKILPLTAEEKNKYPSCKSKIVLPFLTEYETLHSEKVTKKFNAEEIIKLIEKIAKLIKYLHKNNICHGDIYSENIMINKALNINFIDLEAMIIDNYISQENTYYDKKGTFENKKKLTLINDKLSLFSLLLYYLSNGTFYNQMNDYVELTNLNLPKYIKQELSSYQLKAQEPKTDYYFEDILTELLKIGYESPKLLERSKK